MAHRPTSKKRKKKKPWYQRLDVWLIIASLTLNLFLFRDTYLTRAKLKELNQLTDSQAHQLNDRKSGEFKQKAANTPLEQQLKKDEPWLIPEQWELTLHDVKVTNERNAINKEKDQQVIVIDYSYANLGYEHPVQDLFLKPSLVLDGAGEVATTYPLTSLKQPQPTPNGTNITHVKAAYVLPHHSDTITVRFSQYDNHQHKQQAIYDLEVTQ